MEIIYKNYTYQLFSNKAYQQNKITYKCKYKRQIKNKNENELYICGATITAIRNQENKAGLSFYLKKTHKEACINQYNTLQNINKKKPKNNGRS